MNAKLQFGNEEHINLVRLATELEGCVEIRTEDHGCDCEYCDYEREHCIACGETDDYLFVGAGSNIFKCSKCGQKAAYRNMFTSLKFKLKELQSDAK